MCFYRIATIGICLIVPLCTGCPSLTPLPSQASVREMVEQETGRPYQLYVPSIYNTRRPWPVVFACHGTEPYDNPSRQMSEWAQFGEDQGIIVIAPTLLAAKGDFPPPVDKQIALQRADETAMLNMIRAVKASHRVSEEQVFMTGWSAAAYDILHTGMSHPDIFRALLIRQGTFDERFVDVSDRQLDRWQPIKIIYGSADFLRDDAIACIKWLRSRGQYVEEQEVAGSHRRLEPETAWKFFREVVSKRPWIRMRTWTPDPRNPLIQAFAVDAVPPAKNLKWFFGDGADSFDPQPTHTYASGGDYEVTLNVDLGGGKKFQRKRTVRVFQGGAN